MYIESWTFHFTPAVGIARKKADEAAKADETMDEAFADLDSLMKKARDMVCGVSRASLRSEKDHQNIDIYRGLIWKFCLFGDCREAIPLPP